MHVAVAGLFVVGAARRVRVVVWVLCLLEGIF